MARWCDSGQIWSASRILLRLQIFTAWVGSLKRLVIHLILFSLLGWYWGRFCKLINGYFGFHKPHLLLSMIVTCCWVMNHIWLTYISSWQSDFYHVLLFHAKGKPVPTIFATQDEELHRLLKRPIASIYSMSNLVSFESYVDTTMTVLLQEFDCRFVATQEVCDLGKWLQMFAFDVMGEITFSKRLGFLESGDDVSGLMDQIWQYFKKSAPVSALFVLVLCC